MKNMNANKLTVEQVEAATAALVARRDAMPFLVSLAPEQRQKRRLSARLLRTAENRLEAARRHREALPASFDFRQFEREVAIAAALEKCLAAADSIRSQLQDTLQVIGTRNIQAGAEVFGYIKTASTAEPGLKRTLEQLTRRRPTSAEKPPSNRLAPATPSEKAPAKSASPSGPAAAPEATPGATPGTAPPPESKAA